MKGFTLDEKVVKFPRRWKNNVTGKEFKVVPWWDMMEDDTILRGSANIEKEDRKFKIGCICQVGWLIQNEGGVFIGVGLSAAKIFTDVGDWVENEQKA